MEFEKFNHFNKQYEQACKAKNFSVINANRPANSQWIPVNLSINQYTSNEAFMTESEEIFHNSTLSSNNIKTVTTAFCGEIYRDYREVTFFLPIDFYFTRGQLKIVQLRFDNAREC